MLDLDALSEADQTWLTSRPEFSDWKEGGDRVCGQVDAWLASYVSLVFSRQPSSDVLDECRRRIWQTWFSFWKAAVEFVQKRGSASPVTGFCVTDDGFKVAEYVRQGIRPTTGRQLGGNPFHDVVLASGALAGDSRSIERLQAEYTHVFLNEVKRADQDCDSEVWLNLVQELVCRVGSGKKALMPGRLASYRGESSLRAWLRPVIRNFLIDRSRLKTLQALHLDPRDLSRSESFSKMETPSAARQELLAIFRRNLLRSLFNLTQVQRDILFMNFGKRRENRSIAEFLGISPGNVTRQRKNAIERLVILVREALSQEQETGTKGDEALSMFMDELGALPKPELLEALLGSLELAYQMGSTCGGTLLIDLGESAMSLGVRVVNRRKSKRVKKSSVRDVQRQHPECAIQKLQPTNDEASVAEAEIAEPTPVAEQPVAAINVTDSVDSMLPSCERLQAVDLDEGPESVLERGRVQDSSTRPSILCIDARKQNVDTAENWLRTFCALISEQFVDGDSSETLPWTPAIAVALPIGVQNLSDEWTERSDIDWLLSQEDGVNVCDLYLNAMRKRLTRFLSGVPARISGAPQQDQLVRFDDMLTESQRAAWAMTIEDDEAWDDH